MCAYVTIISPFKWCSKCVSRQLVEWNCRKTDEKNGRQKSNAHILSQKWNWNVSAQQRERKKTNAQRRTQWQWHRQWQRTAPANEVLFVLSPLMNDRRRQKKKQNPNCSVCVFVCRVFVILLSASFTRYVNLTRLVPPLGSCTHCSIRTEKEVQLLHIDCNGSPRPEQWTSAEKNDRHINWLDAWTNWLSARCQFNGFLIENLVFFHFWNCIFQFGSH